MGNERMIELRGDDLDAAWNKAMSYYEQALAVKNAGPPPVVCCCANEGKPLRDPNTGTVYTSHNAGCRVPGHGVVSNYGFRRKEGEPNRGHQSGSYHHGSGNE
jgi:hypothetical protein